MKKFAKLIPVALGLLTLASCSNDDFFGQDSPNALKNLGEDAMVVTVEEVVDGKFNTRAYWNEGTTAEDWTFDNYDLIRVYDANLFKYDVYKNDFKSNEQTVRVFRRAHQTSNINNQAQFAIYPDWQVEGSTWKFDRQTGESELRATVTIPAEFGYDRMFKAGDTKYEKPFYLSALPQWGEVTSTGDGTDLSSQMQWLTGIFEFSFSGLGKYVKEIHVSMLDNEGNPFYITGPFTTLLESAGVKQTVANNTPAELKALKTQATLVREDYPNTTITGGTEMVMNVENWWEINNLDKPNAGKGVAFLPLVTTDEPTTIVITDQNGKELGRWYVADGIKRGQIYKNNTVYNGACGDNTLCGISDYLEGLADVTGDIVVNLAEPLIVTDECSTLRIPTIKASSITINAPEGVDFVKYATGTTSDYRTSGDLPIVYKTPANPYTNPVSINISGKKEFIRNLDVDLGASPFIFSGEAASKAQKIDIDATEFVAGDAVTRTSMKAPAFSDNVKRVTVKENAELNYLDGVYSPYYALVIDDTQNSGIEDIVVNGAFLGSIDARTKVVTRTGGTPAETGVNILIQGSDVPALYFGGIRTLGKIDVTGKALVSSKPSGLLSTILAAIPVPSGATAPTLPTLPANVHGIAAGQNVNISQQAFVEGAVFSWHGDVDINNTGLNAQDWLNDGGKLSSVIYSVTGLNISSATLDGIKFIYGPLYAEEGSVKIIARNSDLKINKVLDTDIATLLPLLNHHAQETVKFAVYGYQDIDIDAESMVVDGMMWAEEDAKLKGKTTCNGLVVADRDFELSGESNVYNVKVGQTATIAVDPREGNCEAVRNELIFWNNVNAEHDVKDGNTLKLHEGYVKQVTNGTPTAPVDVNLFHKTNEGAFTAIGSVINPDNITVKNTSFWNGKQIPTDLKSKYVVSGDKNIWTASELAAQTTGITTYEPTLHSNVNLQSFPWTGINVNDNYYFNGSGKVISNLNIVGKPNGKGYGFVNLAEKNLTVNDLTFNGVHSTIANVPAGLSCVGGVAGKVENTTTLTRVKVVLDGDLGSDGTANLTATQIGGAVGNTYQAEFNGVRFSGKGTTGKSGVLAGWAEIGGLIGKLNGSANIKNAAADSEHEAMETTVKNLAINVTYCATPANGKVNDLEQGKTGLYIGSADLTATGTQITIDTSDESMKDWTLTGAKEDKCFFNDATNPMYARKFVRSTHQKMIGQSGFEMQKAKVNIKRQNGLDAEPFEVKVWADKDGQLATGNHTGWKSLYDVQMVELQVP